MANPTKPPAAIALASMVIPKTVPPAVLATSTKKLDFFFVGGGKAGRLDDLRGKAAREDTMFYFLEWG